MWVCGPGLDHVARGGGHVGTLVRFLECESHMSVMFVRVIEIHLWGRHSVGYHDKGYFAFVGVCTHVYNHTCMMDKCGRVQYTFPSIKAHVAKLILKYPID